MTSNDLGRGPAGRPVTQELPDTEAAAHRKNLKLAYAEAAFGPDFELPAGHTVTVASAEPEEFSGLVVTVVDERGTVVRTRTYGPEEHEVVLRQVLFG